MLRRSVLLLSLMLTGCLIIPTGAMRVSPKSRRPISDEQVRSLSPGSTTRADVLLALGSPEFSLEDETYFIYWWSTESGMVGEMKHGTAFNLNTSHHDLLFEFNHAGFVYQAGDLKALLADGRCGHEPPGRSDPSTIPIRTGWWDKGGQFVFHPGGMRLELTGEGREDFEVPRGGALVLDYRKTREGSSYGDWRPYDLKFRDKSGQVREVGLEIPVGVLIPLARHLRQHSPELRIYD